MSTDKSVALMDEAIKCAKTIGPQKTMEALVSARNSNENQNSKKRIKTNRERLICQQACNQFSITYDELYEKHSRHPDKEPALVIISAYFNLVMKYSNRATSEVIGHHISRVSRLVKQFNHLNPLRKDEKTLMEKYELLCQSLQNKINI